MLPSLLVRSISSLADFSPFQSQKKQESKLTAAEAIRLLSQCELEGSTARDQHATIKFKNGDSITSHLTTENLPVFLALYIAFDDAANNGFFDSEVNQIKQSSRAQKSKKDIPIAERRHLRRAFIALRNTLIKNQTENTTEEFEKFLGITLSKHAKQDGEKKAKRATLTNKEFDKKPYVDKFKQLNAHNNQFKLQSKKGRFANFLNLALKKIKTPLAWFNGIGNGALAAVAYTYCPPLLVLALATAAFASLSIGLTRDMDQLKEEKVERIRRHRLFRLFFAFHNAKNNRLVDDALSLTDAYQLTEDAEKALLEHKNYKQVVAGRLGKSFSILFSLVNGVNNGNSARTAIIVLARMLGFAGLTIGSPYVAIAGLVIGFSSLTVNIMISLATTERGFIRSLTLSNWLQGIRRYGNDGEMQIEGLRHWSGFVIGALVPALFSSIALSVLFSYGIMLTAMATPAIAAYAMPISLGIFASTFCTLSLVYLEAAATLVHFEEGVSGKKAIYAYLSELINPVSAINERINAKLDELERLGVSKEDRDSYREAIYSKAFKLSWLYAAVGMTGVGLTIVAAVIAAPVMFPSLSIMTASIIGVGAIPGQMPFYIKAAASLATKNIISFSATPEATSSLEEEQPMLNNNYEETASIKVGHQLTNEKEDTSSLDQLTAKANNVNSVVTEGKLIKPAFFYNPERDVQTGDYQPVAFPAA